MKSIVWRLQAYIGEKHRINGMRMSRQRVNISVAMANAHQQSGHMADGGGVIGGNQRSGEIIERKIGRHSIIAAAQRK